MKRCLVVYATPARQWQWEVRLGEQGTVADALTIARASAGALEVPWDAPVGIFGALCDRNAVPRDGDRIEIYRPLRADPKESRRARARAGRQGPDQASPRPAPASKRSR